MMRRSTRRAGNRVASTLLVFGVAFGLALGAVRAFADETPADSAKAAAEMKADEAKAHAKEAKEAGEAKAAEARSKAKQAKHAAKTAKTAKGGSVSEGTKAAPGTMPVKPNVEPQHVQVQHILIGFAGSIPGKGITRTKEEAKKLAYEVLEKARKGEDYDALVKQYTEDSPPGIYEMSGLGVPAGPGEYPRDKMVPAFGNVGFAISPGNIGIADYDPQTSPYGWHIIKRLK